MYNKILVPLDGSTVAEQVLPYARFLAAKLKAPTELLAVIDSAAISGLALTHNPRYVRTLTEEGRRAAESYLARVSKTFDEKFVTAAVEVGKPEEVIIEKAALATRECRRESSSWEHQPSPARALGRSAKRRCSIEI